MPLGFSPPPLRNEKKKDCSFRAPALNREEAGRAASLKGRHVTKKKKREAPCETFSHGAPYCEDRTCGGVARSPSRKGRRGVARRRGGTGARPSDRLGATSLLSLFAAAMGEAQETGRGGGLWLQRQHVAVVPETYSKGLVLT